MRLGFCTPLDEERIDLASSGTFDGVELFLSPGSALDPSTATDDDIQQAKDLCEEDGVEVLSVFHFEDYASSETARATQARKNITRVMDIAEALNTPVICCNAWVAGDNDDARLASYRKIFGAIAKIAEDRGFQIAIENCPLGGRNIARSPVMWERMFDAIPSECIGLEYDPSHLVWQGIDPIAPIREFGSRIYSFHAKDAEILHDRLQREGTLGNGWWRSRIPGYGQIDWQQVFSALADIRYTGDVILEHEDPVFQGDRFDQGLRLGVRHLRKFML